MFHLTSKILDAVALILHKRFCAQVVMTSSDDLVEPIEILVTCSLCSTGKMTKVKLLRTFDNVIFLFLN